MDNCHNDWKEEVLNSMIGSKKVSPPDSLFDKINSSINEHQDASPSVVLWSYFAASVVGILILINVFSIAYFRNVTSYQEESGVKEFYDQFFVYDFQIYS